MFYEVVSEVTWLGLFVWVYVVPAASCKGEDSLHDLRDVLIEILPCHLLGWLSAYLKVTSLSAVSLTSICQAVS